MSYSSIHNIARLYCEAMLFFFFFLKSVITLLIFRPGAWPRMALTCFPLTPGPGGWAWTSQGAAPPAAGCCYVSLAKEDISALVVPHNALRPLPHSTRKLILAFPEEKQDIYVMKYK